MRKEDVLTYLYKAKAGKIDLGLTCGVPLIDNHLRFKRGNFNVIIGHANVGKTTVILYLFMLYSIKHGLKWWIYSAENKTEGLYRKLVEFYANKPIQMMSKGEIEQSLAFVFDHFQIMDSEVIHTYKTLLQTLEIGLETWAYDGCLIDPYNSLSKDAGLLKSIGGHEYDYQVASEFRLFCKQKSVTLYLNAHCVTEALRKVHPKKHRYEGLPLPPNMADVEGGGKWGNRADDVISLHRYVADADDWMFTEIHVRKVKETETGGLPTPYDNPVRMRMVRNNCGFEIAGDNPIKTEFIEQTIL